MVVDPVVVFLDTEAFESQGFNYQSGSFRRLKDRSDSKDVELFLTATTDAEVRQHVSQLSSTYVSRLRGLVAESRILLALPELAEIVAKDSRGKMVTRLVTMYDEFKSVYVKRIVPHGKMDMKPIMEAYAQRRPPFDKADKKHEFPDAISLLEAYQAKETQERQAVFVSADKDFPELIATLGIGDKIRHIATIDLLIDYLIQADAIKKELRQVVVGSTESIEEQLNEQFYDLGIMPVGYDADLEEGSVLGIAVGDVVFVEVEKDYGLAEVELEAEMRLTIDYGDPEFTYYDSEEPEPIVLERKKGNYTISLELKVEMEFERPDSKEAWSLTVLAKKDPVTIDFDPYEMDADDA